MCNTDELLKELAEAIETAAVDLQGGDVEAAGHELWNASVHIQEQLNEDAETVGDSEGSE